MPKNLKFVKIKQRHLEDFQIFLAKYSKKVAGADAFEIVDNGAVIRGANEADWLEEGTMTENEIRDLDPKEAYEIAREIRKVYQEAITFDRPS